VRRIARIFGVTGGLFVAGLVAGAVVGALMAPLVAVRIGFSGEALFAAFMGAVLGGVLGAILGPLTAWTVARDIPIWRIIVHAVAGTMAGALVGLVIKWQPIALTFVGFVVGVLVLRLRTRREVYDSPSVRER